MEKLVLEMLFRHMENKKASGSSQYGFIKGKSYLTNLLTFSNMLNRLAVEGRTVDIANLSGEHLTLYPIRSSYGNWWRIGQLAERKLGLELAEHSGPKGGEQRYEMWLKVSSKQFTSEDTVRLFSVMFHDGRRDSMHRLKPGRLSEDQETLFHCEWGDWALLQAAQGSDWVSICRNIQKLAGQFWGVWLLTHIILWFWTYASRGGLMWVSSFWASLCTRGSPPNGFSFHS